MTVATALGAALKKAGVKTPRERLESLFRDILALFKVPPKEPQTVSDRALKTILDRKDFDLLWALVSEELAQDLALEFYTDLQKRDAAEARKNEKPSRPNSPTSGASGTVPPRVIEPPRSVRAPLAPLSFKGQGLRSHVPAAPPIPRGGAGFGLAMASVRRTLLDEVIVNGKQLRVLTLEEGKKFVSESPIKAKFVELLTDGIKGAVVDSNTYGHYWGDRPDELVKLWKQAQGEGKNAA